MQDVWSFFAFPLNLILAALWTAGWVLLRRSRPDCVAVRFLLSPSATISSIVLMIAACLWVGLSGDRMFVRSVFFAAILLYMQTVVLMVLLRGWKRKDGAVRWRFICLHAGLLLAVGAGFWGSPDSEELRVILDRGVTSNEAFRLDGSRTSLSYSLTLNDLWIEVTPDGKHSYYEAELSVNASDPVRVSVNHPHSVGIGEDIYLSSMTGSSCILQIVREPWRYFALAGIVMMLVGAFMLFIKGPKQ